MRPGAAEVPLQVERDLRAILASLPDHHSRLTEVCAQVEDWPALLAAARDHGLASVVLAAARRARVPASVIKADAVTQELRLGAVWQDILRDTVRNALTALEQREVPAVALKGPLLAARLYDDEIVRISTDVDLLVAPASIDQAVLALRPLGYELEGGAVGRFYRSYHHHVHLLHPTLPPLELHFEAYRGFGTVLPAAPLLGRSITCAVPGWGQVRVLSPEDEFVYLAVHAASHRFQRLLWLFDLKLHVLRHASLRWEDVAMCAKAHRVSAAVSFACQLLSDWLDVPAAGSIALPTLAEARFHAARYLARRQPIHVVNAAADLFFSTLLCDNASRRVELWERFVRMKISHDAPLRLRALFSSQ
jgi:hypothetical protein